MMIKVTGMALKETSYMALKFNLWIGWTLPSVSI